MADTFKELMQEQKSGASTTRLRGAMLDMTRKFAQAKDDKFIVTALQKAGNFDVLKRLESCQRGKHCGYIYCSECRERYAGKLLERWNEHRSEMTDKTVRQRFRFVTILHSLECCDVEELAAATKLARQEFNNFKRKFNI